MQVVDRVEVHVLRVPGERRLPHAKVKVGRVHAGDRDLEEEITLIVVVAVVLILISRVCSGYGYDRSRGFKNATGYKNGTVVIYQSNMLP